MINPTPPGQTRHLEQLGSLMTFRYVVLSSRRMSQPAISLRRIGSSTTRLQNRIGWNCLVRSKSHAALLALAPSPGFTPSAKAVPATHTRYHKEGKNMITRMTPSISWHILPVVAVAVAGMVVSAHADPQLNGPCSVEVSVKNNTVSQGEPIIVQYKITNTSTTEIYPDHMDGRHQWFNEIPDRWYHFEVKNCSTNVVTPLPDLASAYKGVPSEIPHLPGIPKNSSYDGDIVASQPDNPLQPGNYILSAQAELPCTSGPDRLLNSWPVGGKVLFPITITLPDSTRLLSKARIWRTYVMANTDPVKQVSALRSLFALPEQSALPEWQDLVSDETLPDNVRTIMAEEIARVNSPAAADLLAQLCWEATEQKHKGPPVLLYLSAMWQQGDINMKRHIEGLAASHGERMPFVPLMRLD
jgi:hypothetical protein